MILAGLGILGVGAATALSYNIEMALFVVALLTIGFFGIRYLKS
jgi:hypothetical protein